MNSLLTKIKISKPMFSEIGFDLIEDDEFKVTLLKYASGVEGIKIANSLSSMVVLPYMGHQIWQLEFKGQKFTQQSVFDQPLATTKFGDNYGGFLIHCGLTNINCAGEGESYPLHGELPFAQYTDNYVGIGSDDGGRYLTVGGKFTHRNSQEYHYEYHPQLKIYEQSTVVHMHSEIHNKRHSPLDYLFMCHMNWLGVDGSRIIYSAKKDEEHIQVSVDQPGSSERSQRLYEFSKQVEMDPTLVDTIDFSNQVYDPELCINMRYEADEEGWGHAMQVMPTGEACYVGFNTSNLPYGLRWYCKTEDENGIGICLPTTGTNQSSKYQYENGLFNTIAGNSFDSINFRFGYLEKQDTDDMEKHINTILERGK